LWLYKKIGDPLKMCAETYTRPDTGAPASNYMARQHIAVEFLSISLVYGADN
jgi:hypothetical protein